jgi:hypothetical protein
MTESTLPSPRSRLAALIADARRRGRRRHFALVLIGLLALLVAGGIWATLDLTGGGGGTAVHAPPGFHVVQSEGPVARRVLEIWDQSQPVSVDLATGTGRLVRTTNAIWYDDRGGVSRVVIRADGQVQHDDAFACPRSAPRPCVEGAFAFRKYWPVDKSRFTRQPGIGTFHGRPVIWIAVRQRGGFAAPPGFGERIGLDPRTHEPVADRVYGNGKIATEALVLERKPDIAAGKFAFVVADSTAGPRLGQNRAPELSARGNNPYAQRARHALGLTPLWLGERFAGRRLEAVTIGSTFTPVTGISPKATTYVLYDYGNVAIDEFNARDLPGARAASLPGHMTLLSSATRTGPSSRGLVVAQLIRKGVLATVLVGSSPSRNGNFVLDRAGALRVARALRPVPLP